MLISMHIRERITSYSVTGDMCRVVLGGQRSCYKLLRAQVTWDQARNYCRNLVGRADLVSIESELEQIFLVDAIQGNSSGQIDRHIDIHTDKQTDSRHVSKLNEFK